jgi:hypothetical protein
MVDTNRRPKLPRQNDLICAGTLSAHGAAIAELGGSGAVAPRPQSRSVTMLTLSGQPLLAVSGQIPIAANSPAPQHHGIKNRNTTWGNTLTFWGRPGGGPEVAGPRTSA